jgi:protein involved in sex pheromone biosynthesis
MKKTFAIAFFAFLFFAGCKPQNKSSEPEESLTTSEELLDTTHAVSDEDQLSLGSPCEILYYETNL